MQVVTTSGLDIAKSVFQVHGIEAEGIHTANIFSENNWCSRTIWQLRARRKRATQQACRQ